MPGNVLKYTPRSMGSQVMAPGCIVLVTMVACVMAWAFPVWPGDEALLVAVQSWESPLLTTVFGMLTYLGWYPVAAAVSLAAVVALLWRRRVAEALLLSVAVSSALLTHLLKVLIGRPRPDFAIVEPVPHSMGFPSGHAAFAILLGGMLIYLAWRHVEDRRLRWGLGVALSALVLGVGLSRVYLGVHWPSDVAGGYLYGASVLALLALLVSLKSWLERRRAREPALDTAFPKVGI